MQPRRGKREAWGIISARYWSETRAGRPASGGANQCVSTGIAPASTVSGVSLGALDDKRDPQLGLKLGHLDNLDQVIVAIGKTIRGTADGTLDRQVGGRVVAQVAMRQRCAANALAILLTFMTR
jgi:hypothetical protein